MRFSKKQSNSIIQFCTPKKCGGDCNNQSDSVKNSNSTAKK